MRLLWEDRAWEEYVYWQGQDKKTFKRLVEQAHRRREQDSLF